MAPKDLPTLPGIGGDGEFYHQFERPQFFWNSKYIETLQVKRIILDEKDESTPANLAELEPAVPDLRDKMSTCKGEEQPLLTHHPCQKIFVMKWLE